MKKRQIALMAAVCLAVTPMSVFAEKTDYSYLEDMTVKELKELDAEIHKLLGSDVDNVAGEESSSEKEEITNEDLAAIMVVKDVREKLKAPHSLEIYELAVKKIQKEYYVHFNFAAQNSAGGMMETDGYYIVFYNEGAARIQSTLAILMSGDYREYFAENKKAFNASSIEAVEIDSEWVLDHLNEDTQKIKF